MDTAGSETPKTLAVLPRSYSLHINKGLNTMNQTNFVKIRLYFTISVALAVWAQLVWNHFNGGVPSHYILANKELPAISNWWGAILLPVLTWFLLYCIQKRALNNQNEYAETPMLLRHLLYGFLGALLFGALLSAFFSFGYADLCGYMVLGLFPLALFFPIYRAECLLGFVLAMTFTFGAILPTGFGVLLSLAGLLLYRYIRSGLLYVGSSPALFGVRRKPKANQ
jgi:hypothetical protein